MGGAILLVLAVLFAVGLTAAVSLYIYYGRMYMRARTLNADVSMAKLWALTTSGVSAYRVVTAYLNAKQAGYDVALARFEAHARSGGDPLKVSRRLELARRDGGWADVDAAFTENAPNTA